MFTVGKDSYGFPDPDGELDWMKNDAHVKLSQVLTKAKDSLVYEYDFGDSWKHQVVLSRL